MISIMRAARGPLCAALAAAALASGEAAGADKARAAQALIEEALDADGGSGVMAAVILDGRLVWSGAAGFADLEARIPLRNDHKLRIGSVSKPLTAVLALKLVEAGALDLDAPIQTYVPAFPAKGAPITIRQLGAHSAGIRHYDFSNYFEANNVLYYPELAGALDVFKDDPLISAPGEALNYSSFGFNLIGMAIEAVTKASFEDSLQTYVSGPLALEATRTNNSLDIIDERAEFYTVTAANPVMTWMKDGDLINTIFRDDSDLYPSGGLLSNAENLATFADAAFRTKFLTPASRQTLTTAAQLNDATPAQWNERGSAGAYSFGWGVFKDGAGRIYYGHGGETNGAFALVRHYPEFGLTVAGVANYNTVTGETEFFEAIGEKLPAIFLKRR